MNIRKAKKQDIKQCAKNQKISMCTRTRCLKNDELLIQKYLKKYLNNEHSTILVAENNDEILGHIVFSFDEWNNSIHIDLLFVRQDKQKQGIGSKLIDAVIEHAKKSSIRIIFLETGKTENTAIKFYEKKGFCVAGHIKNMYDEMPGDASVLSRKFE